MNLRYTLRILGKKPGFTLAAVLVLALGIGANTAIFTVINATLLQPLPYPDPDRLVRLFERNVIGESPFNVVSPLNFDDWHREARSYTGMAAYAESSYNLASDQGRLPEELRGMICTHELLPVLRIQLALGRWFTAADDTPEAPRSAVISHGLWQRRFGGDRAAVGKTLRMDGEVYTVLGVLPPWFDFPFTGVQVWAPLRREMTPAQVQQRGRHRLSVVARLRPGVSVEQARTELDGIARRIKQQHPEVLTGAGANVASLKERTVIRVRTLLYVLLGAVSLVLLIACVNVANLFLARAVGRRREAAIRMAVGATRGRLIRQFLTESLVVALLGGGVGLLLANEGTGALVRMATDLPRPGAVHVDGWVLLFTFGISMLTGVVSGLAPALFSSDLTLATAIRDGGRSATRTRHTNRLRDALVAAEVALSVMLLIGAGLLVKSFARLRGVDPGTRVDGVLTMRFSLPTARYETEARRASFYQGLVAKVQSLPGVTAAGMVTTLPAAGHFMDTIFEVEGRPPLPPGQFQDALYRAADPGYFQTIGIPLKAGRFFLPGERLERARQMIISESMQKRFFPTEDPLGHKLRLNGATYEIVGVVGDVRKELSVEPEPTMYTPLLAGDFPFAALVARTAGDPNTLAMPIQKELARMDPDLPAMDVLTMHELLSQSVSSRRFGLTLLALFAGLAVTLAAVGLYGVLAYSMSQRTSELGVRIALGATRWDLSRIAVLAGLKPTVLGVAVGLAGAAASVSVMKTLLFEVSTLDPAVFGAVAALVCVVGIGACVGPALRVGRVDPVVALRSE